MGDAVEYLFVYGTLRRGGRKRLRRMLERQAGCLGRGVVAGALYDLGPYPALTDAPGGRVRGELYRLRHPGPTLKRLDRYEGCAPTDRRPHEYRRVKREVELTDGRTLTAWAYLYQWSLRGAHPLRCGDWKRRSRAIYSK